MAVCLLPMLADARLSLVRPVCAIEKSGTTGLLYTLRAMFVCLLDCVAFAAPLAGNPAVHAVVISCFCLVCTQSPDSTSFLPAGFNLSELLGPPPLPRPRPPPHSTLPPCRRRHRHRRRQLPNVPPCQTLAIATGRAAPSQTSMALRWGGRLARRVTQGETSSWGRRQRAHGRRRRRAQRS